MHHRNEWEGQTNVAAIGETVPHVQQYKVTHTNSLSVYAHAFFSSFTHIPTIPRHHARSHPELGFFTPSDGFSPEMIRAYSVDTPLQKATEEILGFSVHSDKAASLIQEMFSFLLRCLKRQTERIHMRLFHAKYIVTDHQSPQVCSQSSLPAGPRWFFSTAESTVPPISLTEVL